MGDNSFAFRYPPPPPPPSNYSTSILPPLPPEMPPPIVKPPPPPPPPPSPTANQNWLNWPLNVDFSQPPPPVYPSAKTHKTVTKYGYKSSPETTPSQNLSPLANQESSVYYGINNVDISYYNSKQYNNLKRYKADQSLNNQTWMQRNRSLQKLRHEGRVEYNSNPAEHGYYRSNDLRYSRPASSSEPRYSFVREINSVDLNLSNETKHYEEGHRCRKRKKPLSQTVPAKRAWTDEEAQIAIDVEREYNKLCKNHSLKIKFPDQELNRDIVTKFHNSIETVYFQQPSNPRFCFVTLNAGADPNTVIEELNKIKFGLGFLSAEYKKDREEEQNVGPEDIDPLTLYVGNLAQEVTKEDMVNFFPKNKRIDIGFAKKMRYTRYAFVSFKNVQDSIEAFKATHYADLHSKSMIVRFRRLHGTVGMPGEPKLQPTSKDIQDDGKKKDGQSSSTNNVTTNYLGHTQHTETEEIDRDGRQPINQTYPSPSHSPHHNDYDRRTVSECSDSSNFDPSLVKNEPYEYPDDYEDSHSDTEELRISEECNRNNTQNIHLAATVKKEISLAELSEMPFPVRPIPLKEEPGDDESNIDSADEGELENGLQEPKQEIDYQPEEPANPEVNEEEFNTATDFGSVLDNLKKRSIFMP